MNTLADPDRFSSEPVLELVRVLLLRVVELWVYVAEDISHAEPSSITIRSVSPSKDEGTT